MLFFFVYYALVLEEHIVLKSNRTKPSEYRAAIKMVGIGTESIDNIVIIPNIYHWDLCISYSKKTLGKPHA